VTDERWLRVKLLFQAAVERPTEERDAFLAAMTGDDPALRREVESLLTSDIPDGSFLDRLPVASESILANSPAALRASVDHTPSHKVLVSGVRVGPYEIVALLGAGAMGEVYRACDTRLNREVALKVLPERFALDSDRSSGSTFSSGKPARVFEASYSTRFPPRSYDVSPDGRRFLMMKDGPAGDPNTTPASMVVVEHWFEELKQRVPMSGK
jgi:hypothetical protein